MICVLHKLIYLTSCQNERKVCRIFQIDFLHDKAEGIRYNDKYLILIEK